MTSINTKCQNITIKLILDFELIDFYFYFKQEIGTSYLHGNLGSPPVYIGGVNVAHLFSFLCCVFCLSSSCVPSVSGLSIQDYPFGFL